MVWHFSREGSMDELEEAVFGTWEKVRERVLGDWAELERRLSRRRSKMFRMCPRAWCLVVRASDRRIDEWFGWSWRERMDWERLAGMNDDAPRPMNRDAGVATTVPGAEVRESLPLSPTLSP